MSTDYLMKNESQPSSILDPDNRDPMKINKHFQLDFFNVIAEPDTSAYNFEIWHRLLNQVYHYSKIGIYRVLTVLVGLPLMLFWGLFFGVYTFMMIWLAVPARRLMQSMITESGLYVQTLSDAAIGPLFRAMGQMYSNIRLSLFKENIHVTNTVDV